ncbi:RNA polymerase sigma factor [Parapedobacter tibetensis]|uniref:RNA polymerase sigma factor n=1 Tax=Parapedobacter tibetensis TaxID=2972951 RepID=UPI00214D5DAA|nr:RNA polymerase sigma-70 factor [Parapedobacter tibetensis]
MEKFANHSGEELLTGISSGNREAFNEIYLRYVVKVMNFVRRFVHCDDEAEDLAQDVFIHLWANRSKVGDIRNADAFLNTISRNIALKALRKKSLEVSSNATPIYELAHAPISNAVSERLDYMESHRLAQEAIETLPPQSKTVFLLSRDKGLSCDAISRQLHISQNTVKYHIKTALKQIRTYFEIHSPDTLLSVICFFSFSGLI